MQKTKLNKEEQDILDSFESGEWKPVANRRQEIARHVAYARNTLAKNRRVNIRISSSFLRCAAEEPVAIGRRCDLPPVPAHLPVARAMSRIQIRPWFPLN